MAKKILFFIAGAVPTEAERAAAEKLGTRMFRNASGIHRTDGVERCDIAAGLVPAHYDEVAASLKMRIERTEAEGEPTAKTEPPAKTEGEGTEGTEGEQTPPPAEEPAKVKGKGKGKGK